MNSSSFLNLTEHERDKFIYRIISLPRLFELFESKDNVLVKPRRWEDPFENFILKRRVQLPEQRTAVVGFHDEFYAQCWTLQRASDAMWKIYSPRGDAVRLRSSIRKVGSSLWKSRGACAADEVFIGKVQYLRDRKLEHFAKKTLRSGFASPSMRLFASSLLVKRRAFSHECEVRLIFRPHDGAKSDDLFRYPVEPNELIDQIMIDPRLPVHKAETLKRQIRSRTKFKGRIVRSLLYAPPPSWTVPLSE